MNSLARPANVGESRGPNGDVLVGGANTSRFDDARVACSFSPNCRHEGGGGGGWNVSGKGTRGRPPSSWLSACKSLFLLFNLNWLQKADARDGLPCPTYGMPGTACSATLMPGVLPWTLLKLAARARCWVLSRMNASSTVSKTKKIAMNTKNATSGAFVPRPVGACVAAPMVLFWCGVADVVPLPLFVARYITSRVWLSEWDAKPKAPAVRTLTSEATAMARPWYSNATPSARMTLFSSPAIAVAVSLPTFPARTKPTAASPPRRCRDAAPLRAFTLGAVSQDSISPRPTSASGSKPPDARTMASCVAAKNS